ncbi:MAG: PEP-CTERM sorting domain-containing protein [Muricomes sp.]
MIATFEASPGVTLSSLGGIGGTDITQASAVPEPSTAALAALAIVTGFAARRRYSLR